MAWNVESTDEVVAWFAALADPAKERMRAAIKLLEERGPQLGHPYSSQIKGSRHAHMRELRVQIDGAPIRLLYAFDPERTAILLIGGDKTGDDRFYKTMIPLADALYDEHIAALEPPAPAAAQTPRKKEKRRGR